MARLMGLELRLQQKMTQQLVMTPQLQQAIKLLQLSYLELADVLREEMEQNPVLEERETDDGQEVQPEVAGAAEGNEPTAEGQPATSDDAQVASDLQSVIDAPADATPEPTSKEVENDIDWEAYLDTYSYSLPASAGGRPAEDLPSFETMLTKPTSLHEHLRG